MINAQKWDFLRSGTIDKLELHAVNLAALLVTPSACVQKLTQDLRVIYVRGLLKFFITHFARSCQNTFGHVRVEVLTAASMNMSSAFLWTNHGSVTS
jgi:hypothetical protein